MGGDYFDLERALLTYVGQSIGRGKTSELEALGIDLEDMRIIRQLPIVDIQRGHRSSALRALKHLTLDRGALRALLAQAHRSKTENETVDKLVRAGAHHRLVQHFFGTTKEELSTRRKLLNVTLRGRPSHGPALTRKDTLIVINMVQEHLKSYPKNRRARPVHQCDALLSTAKLTGFTVSAIWDAVNAAERRGVFDWAA